MYLVMIILQEAMDIQYELMFNAPLTLLTSQSLGCGVVATLYFSPTIASFDPIFFLCFHVYMCVLTLCHGFKAWSYSFDPRPKPTLAQITFSYI